MGIVAAQAMIDGPSFEGSFSFEIFAHITRFFGYKVSKYATQVLVRIIHNTGC